MVMAYTTKNSISAPIDDWQKAGVSPAPAWVDPGFDILPAYSLTFINEDSIMELSPKLSFVSVLGHGGREVAE
jgi:hypothetical protein